MIVINYTTTFLCLIYFLMIGCSNQTSNTPKTYNDSITNPIDLKDTAIALHPPPLNDIRAYGQLILDHKIQPSDNESTFACLDSIDNENSDTRKFFFKVYRVIAQKSDGALGEVVGSYTKSYLQTYSKEAIENFQKLNFKEQELFIDNLAYEFYASGTDYNTDIKSYFDEIKSSCKECDESVFVSMKNSLMKKVNKMND